tara:strand:- start:731 stop:1033 length:303 start_codon:yes stop_codon:yes gene_type:complete
MCAGVVSESLVQMLAIEGICLKPPNVQRAIDTYYFQTSSGDVFLNSPSKQKGIPTVYKGEPINQPVSETCKELESEKKRALITFYWIVLKKKVQKLKTPE